MEYDAPTKKKNVILVLSIYIRSAKIINTQIIKAIEISALNSAYGSVRKMSSGIWITDQKIFIAWFRMIDQEPTIVCTFTCDY